MGNSSGCALEPEDAEKIHTWGTYPDVGRWRETAIHGRSRSTPNATPSPNSGRHRESVIGFAGERHDVILKGELDWWAAAAPSAATRSQ
jgi:hypothetical protein